MQMSLIQMDLIFCSSFFAFSASTSAWRFAAMSLPFFKMSSSERPASLTDSFTSSSSSFSLPASRAWPMTSSLWTSTGSRSASSRFFSSSSSSFPTMASISSSETSSLSSSCDSTAFGASPSSRTLKSLSVSKLAFASLSSDPPRALSTQLKILPIFFLSIGPLANSTTSESAVNFSSYCLAILSAMSAGMSSVFIAMNWQSSRCEILACFLTAFPMNFTWSSTITLSPL